MPKVTWLGTGKKKPKPYNALAATLRGYKLASGLTSEQIGKKLGVTAENVRHQIGKPANQWNIGALKKYCDVIGCPYEEALAAAAK